jgi:hypothetical protein
VSFVKVYANAAAFEASNASELVLLRQPGSAKSSALTGNQKFVLSKRCKIPAVADLARAIFLTSILPLDILRGSCGLHQHLREMPGV